MFWTKRSGRRCASFSQKTKRPVAASLEMLEARIAPAAVLTLSKGNLLVSGTWDGNLEVKQRVEEVGGVPVVFTAVLDGGNQVGQELTGVKNVVVKPAASITDERYVTLELVRVAGSVQVFSPKAGPIYLTINGLPPVGDEPHIGGNVQLTGGTAYDSITLHSALIHGGVNLIGKGGGNGVVVDGASKVGGNFTALNTSYFQIQSGGEIGKNVLIQDQRSTATQYFEFGKGAQIGGNVSIYGGSNSTSVNAYATVGGNFFLSGGDGYNTTNVSLEAKSFSYLGGGSKDDIWLYKSTFTGGVTINGVAGDNRVIFDVGGTETTIGDVTVGKTFKVVGGKGNDLVRLYSANHKLTVGGAVTALLGNGENNFSWNGQMNGAALKVITGSGLDIVNVFGLTGPAATFTASLGGGDDQLSLTSALKKVIADGQSGSGDAVQLNGIATAIAKLRRFELQS